MTTPLFEAFAETHRRCEERLVAVLGLSRAAAQRMVDAVVDAVTAAHPEFWDDEQKTLTESGMRELNLLLSMMADDPKVLVGNADLMVEAVRAVATRIAEFEVARNDLQAALAEMRAAAERAGVDRVELAKAVALRWGVVTPLVLTVEQLRDFLANPGGEQRLVLATIDPDTARQMLQRYIQPARPLNRRTVASLAEALRRVDENYGPFDFEQVGVAADGVTFKGQHLLHAIIGSGRELQVAVVLNAAPPDFIMLPHEQRTDTPE